MNCIYKVKILRDGRKWLECENCRGGCPVIDNGWAKNIYEAAVKSGKDVIEDNPKKFIPKKYYDPEYDYSCDGRK